MNGETVQRTQNSMKRTSSDKLIKLYFMLGLRRGEILLLLSTVNDIMIGLHGLSWIVKCMGTYRGKNQSNPQEAASSIMDRLEGP